MTGLGLSIVRRLVHLMGGEVSVVSELGVGSVFSFAVDFPIVVKAVSDGDLAHAVLATPHVPSAQGGSVLLVEDLVVNQEIARRFLERLGWDVTVAADGAAAVEAFERHAFDLVLMDVQMPVMDGLVATREIRRREAPGKPRLSLR